MFPVFVLLLCFMFRHLLCLCCQCGFRSVVYDDIVFPVKVFVLWDRLNNKIYSDGATDFAK